MLDELSIKDIDMVIDGLKELKHKDLAVDLMGGLLESVFFADKSEEEKRKVKEEREKKAIEKKALKERANREIDVLIARITLKRAEAEQAIAERGNK